MAKFKFYVSTGYVRSERSEIIEIDDEELDDLSEVEKGKLINELYEDWLWENVNTGWEEIE